MGKLIEHPEAKLAGLRKDTTDVAAVINKQMIALQKKYPDHFFELEFELQRLGPQKFYRIHIRSFSEPKEKEKTPTELLLDFIIAQELDLEKYPSLVEPLSMLFTVWEDKQGTRVPAMKQLVDRIIRWEKGEQESSLETTLNRLFIIEMGKR